ncbi:MAG: ATP-binding protein [Pleomorphochaeta sp.]
MDKSKILELSTFDFVNKFEKVILIRSPRVGKSHISVSPGLEATTNR